MQSRCATGCSVPLSGACCIVLMLLIGCATARTEVGFDAPTSQGRLRAIAEAAESGDLRHVPALVRQLASSDVLVRMMAIETLRELTGEDMGYCFDAPASEREQAIDRWVQAVRAGRFDLDAVVPAELRSATSGGPPSGPKTEQSSQESNVIQ